MLICSIGLGNMGTAMAKNIQRHQAANHLCPLKVFNRTASRMEVVAALGATPCSSELELVKDTDVVFISVSSQCLSLQFSLLETLARHFGGVHSCDTTALTRILGQR